MRLLYVMCVYFANINYCIETNNEEGLNFRVCVWNEFVNLLLIVYILCGVNE